MFSVTVRDHMMIAHSFRGEVFGPAQRLHGATYVVDATFRRPSSTPTTSSSTSAGPPQQLHEVLGRADLPQPRRRAASPASNTSTEALARVVADRLADRIARRRPRRDGARHHRHRGHAARVAHRLGELRAGAVTVRAPRASRPASTTRRGPAAATSTTGGSATSCARPAGAVREHRGDDLAVPADVPATVPARRWSDGLRWCCVDGLIAAPLGPGARRPAAAGRAGAHAHSAQPAERARAGRGRASVITTSAWTPATAARPTTALAPARVHVAEPGVDRRRSRPGTRGGGELLCVGAVAPHKGHDVLLAALATVRRPAVATACCVGSLTATRPSSPRLRRRTPTAGSRPGRLAGPLTGADLARPTPRRTCSCCRRGPRPTGMVVTEALARGLPVIATRRRRRRRSARPAGRRGRPARATRATGCAGRRAARLARRRGDCGDRCAGRPRAAPPVAAGLDRDRATRARRAWPSHGEPDGATDP